MVITQNIIKEIEDILTERKIEYTVGYGGLDKMSVYVGDNEITVRVSELALNGDEITIEELESKF